MRKSVRWRRMGPLVWPALPINARKTRTLPSVRLRTNGEILHSVGRLPQPTVSQLCQVLVAPGVPKRPEPASNSVAEVKAVFFQSIGVGAGTDRLSTSISTSRSWEATSFEKDTHRGKWRLLDLRYHGPSPRQSLLLKLATQIHSAHWSAPSRASHGLSILFGSWLKL